MDKGFLLAIYTVISGWILIILALLLVKPLIIPSSRGLIEAILYIISGAFSIAAALLLWYLNIRRAFLRVKANGPGGT